MVWRPTSTHQPTFAAIDAALSGCRKGARLTPRAVIALSCLPTRTIITELWRHRELSFGTVLTIIQLIVLRHVPVGLVVDAP